MFVCPVCHYRGMERTCPVDGFPMIAESLLEGAADEENLVGRVFGERYEVQQLVGRGGMGWVFRARHVLTDQTVALKVMKRDAASSTEATKRFYREVRTSCRLTSPHTIKVFDFGTTIDGYPYMAMEYLEGASLRQVIREAGALPPGRTAHITRQVCRSLEEAHEKAVIHRDLKPANIFVSQVSGETDFVKVLDFGIAKLLDHADGLGSLTTTGVALGTPKYMSPEQLTGQRLDARSDLYALGVILYEMLTGRVPFASKTTGRLLAERLKMSFPPLATLVPPNYVPPALLDLVPALLQHDPARRPQSATAVFEALADIPADAGSEPFAGPSAPASLDDLLVARADPPTRPTMPVVRPLDTGAGPGVPGADPEALETTMPLRLPPGTTPGRKR